MSNVTWLNGEPTEPPSQPPRDLLVAPIEVARSALGDAMAVVSAIRAAMPRDCPADAPESGRCAAVVYGQLDRVLEMLDESSLFEAPDDTPTA